jgi:hypothetical protein
VYIAVNAHDSPASVAAGGVAFDPLSGGTTTITASAPGFSDHVSSSRDVTVSQPGITISDVSDYHRDNRLGSDLQKPFRITLGGANHGGVTVHIASNDSTVALVSPDATTAGSAAIDIDLADGQTTKTFYVQGVSQASGTVTISATQELFTDGNLQVEVVAPIVFIRNQLNTNTTTLSADDPFRVGTGYIAANGSAYSARVSAAEGPLAVTLISSDSLVGQLITSEETGSPVVVYIAVNAISSPASVAAGGVAFHPFSGGTTTISASAPGFNDYVTSSRDVTVSQPVITISDVSEFHHDNRLGSDLQKPFRITLGGGNHGGVTVHIASSDSAIVLVSPDAHTSGSSAIDVTIPDGQTTKNFYVQGVSQATGTATISVTQELFTDGSVQVEVVPPVAIIRGLSASTTILSADDPFQVRTAYIAANGNAYATRVSATGEALAVTLNSSNPSVGQLTTNEGGGSPLTVYVAVNAYDSPTTVAASGIAFDPLSDGTTTVTASAPGFDGSYARSSTQVTVSQPGIILTDEQWGDYRIGGGLQVRYRLTFGGSEHGGVSVRVASDDTSRLLVSPDATTAGTSFIDIFIPDGQSTADFYVQGVNGVTGAVTLTASSAQFDDGTAVVNVVPGVVSIINLNTSTNASAEDDPFRVRTGYLSTDESTFHYAPVSPAGPLQVLLSSSNTSVGQLKTAAQTGAAVTVEVPVNDFNSPSTVSLGGVAFDPIAAGTTTISTSVIGFNNSWYSSTATVTVSP